MLRETNFLLFLAASLPLILTPGPDMIYVATRGIARGRGVALISASGVGLGYVVHTVLAVAGLSALLQQSATAFLVLKYAGAAYLLYLGVRTLFDRGLRISSRGGRRGTNGRACACFLPGDGHERAQPQGHPLLPGIPAAVR